MKGISKRQQEILDFIKSEVRTKGYPPAVREICEHVGLQSSSTVHGHLARLEKRGLIRRDPTKPRAIEILDEDGKQIRERMASVPFLDLETHQPAKVISVPVVGKVTAGEPITAVENIDDYFPIPDNMAHGAGTVFMLEISGDSMIEAGIFDGDRVIVKQQQSANNGDIVIAMTDENEATCKRFYKENGHFRLQPENSSLEPIILDQVSILGKVVGLYRDRIH